MIYFPYEIIGTWINKFCKSERIKTFFYEKKIAQNVAYIEKNKPSVIKKLQHKLKNKEKINVIFYVYDCTKWKCQSVYDIFNQDIRFNVKILVTKSGAKNTDNPTYQSIEDVEKTYNFFKAKGLNTELAYDIKKEKFIPFKKFSPDIIFYQHPWYVETSQGPVVCSKFALTAYIPYYFQLEVGNIDNKIDYYLRFHRYVEKYYVMNKQIEQKFKQKMENKGENVVVAGYPFLENFKNSNPKGEYVIYAPHWTVGGAGLKYGSFQNNGKFILEYAKSHPEIKWVFKPHPILRKTLFDTGLMTKEEVQKYYEDWAKIGIVYEEGDYQEFFNNSQMMITDSCSFFGEYLVTEKPLIMLMSESSPFSSLENPILQSYYCARNNEELKNLIENVPKNDYMKEKRIKTLTELGLKDNNASENILHDIIKEIGD